MADTARDLATLAFASKTMILAARGSSSWRACSARHPHQAFIAQHAFTECLGECVVAPVGQLPCPQQVFMASEVQQQAARNAKGPVFVRREQPAPWRTGDVLSARALGFNSG